MYRVLFVFLALTFFSSAHASLEWKENFSKAIDESAEDGKPLLLFFTGSDWSGLAMKMKKEVLDSQAFQEKARTHFHCLQIDFPKHKALGDEQTSQNTVLKQRFGVEELPLLLVLDSKEREIMRMGYFPETGEQLVGELLQVVHQDAQLCAGLKRLPKEENALQELYQLAVALSGEEAQKTLLAAGLAIEAPFFQLEQYRLLVEGGRDAHKLREKLLQSQDSEIHFAVAMIDFQQRASTLSDPLEVIKPLEAYLSRFGDQDTQNVWRIEMMIAQFYLDADEWGTALKHAQTAYESAPQTMRGEIENSLLYIRDQIR
ncbi:MAG: hypothetical protein S4CHLAM2_10960 [Chlamydiales bacterium]|nr:hypothetical protein [Chlamydiales bacterium]